MVNILYERAELYRKQELAFFSDARYSFTEASTKSGKTTGALIWLTEQAVLEGGVGDNYWWVSPVSRQARIAYERMQRYLPKGLSTSTQNPMRHKLFNGAYIEFKSADKADSLFGDDVRAAVIDEASRTKDQTFEAVRSTLTATGGKLRAIGNVKGKKNWAYRLGHSAKRGNLFNGEYHVITALDAVEAGIFDRAEFDDAKMILPQAIFDELYMCIPNEDGSNPFGLNHIKEITMEDMSHGDPVVWGWDLAKYVDWTVGIALDRHGQVCRFERFQKDWRTTKLDILELVKRTPCLIDSTGVGDPIVEDLNRERSNIEGYKFTSSSKQQLMEGLAVAIQQKLIQVPQGVIIDELKEFEFQYTRTGGVKYTAPDGFTDDCVMALSLAVKKFNVPITLPNIRML